MSAHTPSPSPPSVGTGSRLPWWGLALPVLAFVLLALIAEPARAESPDGPPALAPVLEYLRQLLMP
ncbi:hypothetical protein [Streptomyces qinzhouensis]|uniref:Uncharacterized protein n=1 Tax=Streptomyces qinzhouensis TaxID=2599401 RepID=A0A5B8IDJ2_9ACTN|nr:hypothetical protein [Streptomyces qinzhouensis]QDY76112.1 hypothetical protein FQU76_05760 [Streptomyces qinzhouensis]